MPIDIYKAEKTSATAVTFQVWLNAIVREALPPTFMALHLARANDFENILNHFAKKKGKEVFICKSAVYHNLPIRYAHCLTVFLS